MVVEPVVLDQWRDELEQVQDRLGELFVRPEPRRQAGLYLEALLSSAERKNGWQLAEQIGDARPWRTQAVLSQALWSQDKARALCRSYVVEHLGAPDGVLVVDETGFLKKGTRSVLRGSTRVRLDALRTARSGCSWAMAAARVML